MTSPPTIAWAGPMSQGPAPSGIPGGVLFGVSNPAFGGPVRSRLSPINANPTIAGYPALSVNRPYVCKGRALSAGSPNVLRLMTDAPTLEIAGFVTVNAPSSQTLIVDGQLVSPKVLSVSNAASGGYNRVAASVSFGTRAMRDIWLEAGMWLAYVKLDASDTLSPVNDSAEPQMTVVGDLYCFAGSSAFANGSALGLEIGARLGIRKVAVDAVSMSGYWNSGYNFGNLNDRVAAHAADNSTLYLVIAGLNDYADLILPPQDVWPTRAQYETAVASYFQALRAAQPNAVIAATAPMCPNATLSDARYVQNSGTNSSGFGDFTYKSNVQRAALTAISGPWVWIDTLMGTGWVNSSGISGGATGLQWFTGGVPAPGTSATSRPGNVSGASGGGFGGIGSVPILSAGRYSQAPDLVVTGGSGRGLLLATTINATGQINRVIVVQPGVGYTSGGLPVIAVDPTFEIQPATLGAPMLLAGINGVGGYPPPAFAPAGVPGGFNNTYVNVAGDLVHPSPAGVDYLASRLAQSLNEAIMAL